MKLYLSSYKFGNFTKELADLAGTNKRAAVIMNALDWGDPVRVAKSLEDQISTLNSLGYNAEQLDLRKYFNKSDDLKKIMSNFGLVWVHGGNSFVLRRAYEQSGFDSIIKELIEKDKIVYGAFSAGVVVISPTLKGVEIVDNPNILPQDQGYQNEFKEDGLGIIKYVVAMHYKSDHPESALVDKYVDYCKKENITYKTLRDGEIILINGKTEKIFTI